MRHATIEDAFNAAAQTTSGFLNYGTANMREQNNLEIKNFNAQLTTNVQNFIRDNPYIGGESEGQDEASYNDYLKKLNTFIDGQYSKAKAGNTSAYFQRTMDQMKTQSLETSRNFALEEQDKWRINREDVSRAKDIQQYISSDEWTPEQKLNAIYNRIDLSGTKRSITPQQKNDMRQAAEQVVFQNYAANRLGKEKDVNNLNDAMSDVHKAFSFMPASSLDTYDEEGNVIGTEERPWGFEGKKEWEAALLEKETTRIQGEHFEIFREKQAYMDRLVVSGNIDEAIRFAKTSGAEWNKYYNPNNKSFVNSNDKYRDAGSRFFDWKTLEEYKKKGLGKEMSLLAAYNMEMFLRPQVQRGSDGTVIVGYDENNKPITANYDSLQEAMEGFFYYDREAFLAANGENAVTLQLYEARKNEQFETFYKEVGTALNQIDPTLADDFKKFRETETYLNKKSDYYMSDSIEDAQKSVDFFHSIFFNGITDVPTIRQLMKEFTGKKIMKTLPHQDTPREEGNHLKQLKAFSDDAKSGKAEDILFKMYTPERLNISGENKSPTFIFRSDAHEKAVNGVMEEERRRTADILGVEINKLLPGWMESERRKDDVIPKGQFTVEEGNQKGRFNLIGKLA